MWLLLRRIWLQMASRNGDAGVGAGGVDDDGLEANVHGLAFGAVLFGFVGLVLGEVVLAGIDADLAVIPFSASRLLAALGTWLLRRGSVAETVQPAQRRALVVSATARLWRSWKLLRVLQLTRWAMVGVGVGQA